MNLGLGILHTYSHSLLIKLYLYTESKAISSKPPNTSIYCESKTEIAEWVHLPFFNGGANTQLSDPSSYFSTELR